MAAEDLVTATTGFGCGTTLSARAGSLGLSNATPTTEPGVPPLGRQAPETGTGLDSSNSSSCAQNVLSVAVLEDAIQALHGELTDGEWRADEKPGGEGGRE